MGPHKLPLLLPTYMEVWGDTFFTWDLTGLKSRSTSCQMFLSFQRGSAVLSYALTMHCSAPALFRLLGP